VLVASGFFSNTSAVQMDKAVSTKDKLLDDIELQKQAVRAKQGHAVLPWRPERAHGSASRSSKVGQDLWTRPLAFVEVAPVPFASLPAALAVAAVNVVEIGSGTGAAMIRRPRV
jgi:hypothetical protein